MVDFGFPAPRRTAAGVARRLEVGEILLRRWAGCWIDLIVLAALVLAPGFAVARSPRVPWTWVFMIPVLLYFPVTESLWGRSLGKLVTGLAVVDAKGRRPHPVRTIIRTLFRLIEVNPFLLGGLPAAAFVAFTPERRRLGDLAAGTYVIHADDARRLQAQATQAEAAESVFD